MRIVGIDPSSTYCGFAVIDTRYKETQVVQVDHWERNKNLSHAQGFDDYYRWLSTSLAFVRPDMAVIEFIAYSGAKSNAQAIQTVAFYQAISALACKRKACVVIEARATTARKAVLGKGNLSKDEVWEIMRHTYPDLFSAKARGGLDEMDALVLALSGPTVAER